MSTSTGSEDESRRWYLLKSLLLVALAVSTYLQVPLMSGNRLLVPSFPTVALIPLLVVVIHRDTTVADVLFLGQVTFVLLLSIALSPGYKYVDEKFLSLVQCTMAIGVAVLAVRVMRNIGTYALERTLLILWTAIIIGVLLEISGVIRGASDAFREWAFSAQYTIYSHDLRDETLVGWSRPKLFSVEPSHVTKFFIATLNAWLLVRVTWTKAAIAAAANVAMLMVMGSPMLVVSMAMTVLIVMRDRRANLGTKAAVLSTAFLLAISFGVLYGGATLSTVAARIASIDDPGTTVSARPSSEQRRVVIPYITLAETWLHSPLFGAGIGGKEVVAEQNKLGLDRPTDALGNNALAEIGVYLGLAGSVWFLSLLWSELRHSGVQRLGLMAVLVALFSQLMGGFVAFQYWGFIALLWGALAVADQNSLPRENPGGRGSAPA